MLLCFLEGPAGIAHEAAKRRSGRAGPEAKGKEMRRYARKGSEGAKCHKPEPYQQPIVIFRYIRHADGAAKRGVPQGLTPRMAELALRGSGMDFARLWEGIGEVLGGIWRGLGQELARL